ncbi:helix-turn-helix transcriptional regulator [Corallococcus exiguus]|uniref:LuxR C-terminal-related transcriptional regulator n=1 Tax=Corallococcus TaxID=83461 RepID=UPI000ECF9763|nr:MULTISPECIES: LuxR C-terminal-related transcriptional regulator [Corallococcus]NPC73823.1 helix-turn-helix transcriptional regulator [Corallococcus exiguus]RKH97018.1 helix-turn-helix transcriptional regulator [Corallococcus sp. AB038B]
MVRLSNLTAAEYSLRDEALLALHDPLSLPEALQALRPHLLQLAQADAMALCLMEGGRSPGYEWHVPGHRLPILERYDEVIEHDFFRGPIFARPNWVVRDSQLMSRRKFEGSFIRQRSIELGPPMEHIMAVLLTIRPGVVAALALYRHLPRPFSAQNADALASITRHLSRAIRKCGVTQGLATYANILEELYRRPNGAILVVEPPHREVLRSPNAAVLLEQWFAPSDLHSSGIPIPLKEQLDALVRMTPDARLGKDTWVRMHGNCSRVVRFIELRAPEGPRKWALMMNELPNSIPLPEQMKCELTPSEVTVAMGVLSNWNDQRIAEELGISRNTVKSHVKSIFATLRVDGRLDLLYQAARLNMPV